MNTIKEHFVKVEAMYWSEKQRVPIIKLEDGRVLEPGYSVDGCLRWSGVKFN